MPARVEYTAAIRRRRLLRWTLLLLATALGATILADHLGAFGYRGDDLDRFDRRRAIIRAVNDDATVQVSTDRGDANVVLLGADPGAGAAQFLRSFVGRSILIRLEPLQSRDAAGRLRAYLYLDDSNVLNVDLVREGWARAERRVRHSLAALMDGAELEAKKKRRGLWKPTTTSATSRSS